MLISEARQTLEDAIAAYCRGSYDTLAEAEALHALIADQPCLLTTGSYHNHSAAVIAGCINRGEATLEIACRAFGRTRALGTPDGNIREYILDALVGINDEGRKALAEARATFARKKESA